MFEDGVVLCVGVMVLVKVDFCLVVVSNKKLL